ncbi:MAG: hypothetical protein J3R72DRAFT_66168 [Linnemannia gamsii]|nr:MAG: hypothetical protein J3R72DRAFT_66168 [Linnemannia gamsii]
MKRTSFLVSINHLFLASLHLFSPSYSFSSSPLLPSYLFTHNNQCIYTQLQQQQHQLTQTLKVKNGRSAASAWSYYVCSQQTTSFNHLPFSLSLHTHLTSRFWSSSNMHCKPIRPNPDD